MNKVPEIIIRHRIIPFLDLPDFYKIMQVSVFFYKEILYIYNDFDTKTMNELLTQYETRKNKWFFTKISNIPSPLLCYSNQAAICLYLQDKFYSTNYVDKLNISCKIYNFKDTMNNILSQNKENTMSRNHYQMIKKMHEENFLSIQSSLIKLNNKIASSPRKIKL